MPTQTRIQSQGLLFSENSIAKTSGWWQLSESIVPDQWVQVCRYSGQLNPHQFSRIQRKLYGNPNSLWNRLKRIFIFEQGETKHLPIVSFNHVVEENL